jgi:type II secretory pathway predicted ATPase ExeA
MKTIAKLQGFYGFTRMPFGRDLAPGMLHRHAAHSEAVARIGWCVTERRIGVITGEVGAGKTVAIRAALSTLDSSRHTIIYLPNPTIGVRGIHHLIVAALGGQPLVHHATLVPQTADALATEQAERGKTPVLVLDEAHLLDHAQLESLRMLTNHDMDSTSPFACLLVGQPTLRRRMKMGALAALDQRIGLRYAMAPMTNEETSSYLRHHLSLDLRSAHGHDQALPQGRRHPIGPALLEGDRDPQTPHRRPRPEIGLRSSAHRRCDVHEPSGVPQRRRRGGELSAQMCSNMLFCDKMTL